MREFTQIKGLSNTRRLPRLGKIKLGIRVKKNKKNDKCKHKPDEMCMYCSYPKETPYFVCPSSVQAIYGEEPTELDIMLPVNDPQIVFPQAYELYGAGTGLKCTGDGESAMRYNNDTKSMDRVDCPCELLVSGKCKQRGHLSVILPRVAVGGVFQIDTSSFNSIIDLNSSMDYIRSMVGRIALIPLILKRVPTRTNHDGKQQTHYTMQIEIPGDVDFINQLRKDTARVLEGPQYSVQAPELISPADDDSDDDNNIIDSEVVFDEIKNTLNGVKTPQEWNDISHRLAGLKDTLSESQFESLANLATEIKLKIQQSMTEASKEKAVNQ